MRVGRATREPSGASPLSLSSPHLVSVCVLVIALLVAGVPPAVANQSGCHAAHSCPSDANPPTYICGDTGDCSECPDNQFCLVGQLRPRFAMGLTLNTSTVVPGDPVQVSITASNSGTGTVVVDLCFVILLPPAAGPSFGCPNGDALVFVRNGADPLVLTCASAPPHTFPAFLPNATFVAGGRTAHPNLLSFPWPAGAPAGTYAFAIVATSPGAFADGEISAGDLLAVDLRTLAFIPPASAIYRGPMAASGTTPDIAPGCFIEVTLTNTVEVNLSQRLFKMFVGGNCTLEFRFRGPVCEGRIPPQITQCALSTGTLDIPLEVHQGQATLFSGTLVPPGVGEYVSVSGIVDGGFASGSLTANLLLGCPPNLGGPCPLSGSFFLPWSGEDDSDREQCIQDAKTIMRACLAKCEALPDDGSRALCRIECSDDYGREVENCFRNNP